MERPELREALRRRSKASEETGNPYGIKFYGVEKGKMRELQTTLRKADPSLQIVILDSLGDAKKNKQVLQSLQHPKRNLAVITTQGYDEQLQRGSDDLEIFASYVSPYGDLMD